MCSACREGARVTTALVDLIGPEDTQNSQMGETKDRRALTLKSSRLLGTATPWRKTARWSRSIRTLLLPAGKGYV
ncbi:unnamed protein product [Scytosiphon promiscuus]